MDEVAGRLELARAELSDLQQTIRHYDTILLQVKSWAITTAVAAGGFALNLARPGIAMLGLLATAAFFLIDGVYRTYLKRLSSVPFRSRPRSPNTHLPTP